MKSKNVSVRTLMEAIKKLETEAYKDFVPGYGKGKGKSTKNWTMSPDDLARGFDDSEKTSPERPSVMAKEEPMSDEEAYIRDLMQVAEDMAGIYFDDSDATRSTTYNLEDTIEDEAFSTTEFVERAADALADTLKVNMQKFAGLSPEAMEDAVKDELMAVLKDMG